MTGDPYTDLIQYNGAAKVTTTYGRSLPFAEEKLSVEVSLTCDQNETTINEAGKLGLLKAMELANDGWSIIDELMKQEAEKQA